MPAPTAVFWSSLTIIDPSVAVVLFIRPRLGLVLLNLLMYTDVAQNSRIIAHYGGVVWMVIDQWIVLGFVLATTLFVWRNADRRL